MGNAGKPEKRERGFSPRQGRMTIHPSPEQSFWWLRGLQAVPDRVRRGPQTMQWLEKVTWFPRVSQISTAANLW